MKFANWKLERDADGIVWATLDVPGAAANTLGSAVLAELGSLLDELDRQPPTGLVIRSGKAAGFIAGADIDEFTRIDSAEAARALVERGWTVFGRLAAVSYPTLALIRGHCMGGGLELTLACRYRLTVDEPGTRLALPEVMLGIYPAWGGMLRLPRLIGPDACGGGDMVRLDAVLLAGGAMQVEKYQPGFRMLGARAADARQRRQCLFALVEIGIGEGDHGFVQNHATMQEVATWRAEGDSKAGAMREIDHAAIARHDQAQVVFVQGLQHIHGRTREQSGVDLERGVFGGGADEGEQAAFHMRQKRILLAFVEAVHLIHKHDGAFGIE